MTTKFNDILKNAESINNVVHFSVSKCFEMVDASRLFILWLS